MLAVAQSSRRSAVRLARGYAAAAPRPEHDEQPESSEAAARRYKAAQAPQAAALSSRQADELDPRHSSPGPDNTHATATPERLSRTFTRRKKLIGSDAYQSARRLAEAVRQANKRIAQSAAMLNSASKTPSNERMSRYTSLSRPDPDEASPPPPADGGFVAPPTSLYSTTSMNPPMPPTERTKADPTLEDLLAKRPDEVPSRTMQKDRKRRDKYASEYNRLHTSVANAFLVKQLAKLAREMGVEVGYRDKKADIVPRILDMWGWQKPLPASTSSSRAVQVRDIELSPAELFLFLRNTETMRELIQGARVSFTVVKSDEGSGAPETGDDMAESGQATSETQTVLRATAQQRGLDVLEEALTNLRQNIRKERIAIVSPGAVESFDILQVVSSMTDVYLAPSAYGGVVATAAAPKLIGKARRLLQSAALTVENMTPTRSLSAVTSPLPNLATSTSSTDVFNASREFSFLPYSPTVVSSLPWNIIATLGRRALFRLRRVNAWGAKAGRREIELESEEMDTAKLTGYRLGSEIVPEIIGGGRAKSLRALLRRQRGEVDQTWVSEQEKQHSAVLSFGHVVYPSSEKGPDAILTPPKPGHAPLDFLLGTPDVERVPPLEPVFVDSQTPAIVQFPLSEPVKRSRRLQYVSQKVDCPDIASATRLSLTCEIKLRSGFATDLPEPASLDANASSSEADAESAPTRKEADWMQELEKMMGDLGPAETTATTTNTEQEATAVEIGTTETAVQPEDGSKSAEQAAPEVVLQLRASRHTDVIMPDRPVDMRVTSSSVSTLMPVKCLNAQMLRFIDDVVEADRPRPWSNSAPAWKTAPEPSSATHPLVPPEKMQVILQDGSSVWMYIQKDEVVDVVEHVVAVPNGSLLDSESPPAEGDQTGTPAPDAASPLVFLRTVKAVDQFIPEAAKPMISNELECIGTTVPESFWRTLAAVTRDLPPNAGILRRDILGATL